MKVVRARGVDKAEVRSRQLAIGDTEGGLLLVEVVHSVNIDEIGCQLIKVYTNSRKVTQKVTPIATPISTPISTSIKRQ